MARKNALPIVSDGHPRKVRVAHKPLVTSRTASDLRMERSGCRAAGVPRQHQESDGDASAVMRFLEDAAAGGKGLSCFLLRISGDGNAVEIASREKAKRPPGPGVNPAGSTARTPGRARTSASDLRMERSGGMGLPGRRGIR